MNNQREYHTVVLAALLHDIGKFLHRGRNLPFRIEGSHPEVSGQFVRAFTNVFQGVVDVDLLETLVTHHHQVKAKDVADSRAQALAYLINKADVLSSRERGADSQGRPDYKTTPLVPVFHRVFSTPDPRSVLRYHPFLLTPPTDLSDSIFPDDIESYGHGELEETIKAFGNQTKIVFEGIGADFARLTSHVLVLLQTYLSAIPANTQEEVPDTSLYDHLKTTGAIAACLYQAYAASGNWDMDRSDDPPLFNLLVGDVSGIQKYVFEIAEKDSSGAGVAKRLRARSLLVQLVSEVAPLQILDKFTLPLTNILMASGGKFYLLLPALPDTERRLGDYGQSAEKWFLNTFNGALGLNLAWVACGDAGLGKGFGATVAMAMTLLDEKKQHGFVRSLGANGGWNASSFVLAPFAKNERACPSCKKFGAPQTDLCPHCQEDVHWGAALSQSSSISISLDPGSAGRELLGSRLNIGGYEAPGGQPSLVIGVNDPDCRHLVKHPASFRYLARHVPVDPADALMDFQEIATKSRGRPYLGFLKADVDRLGEIFAFGLRGVKEDRWDTPSRIATMSRQFDLFFTGWVERLLKSEFKDCYCVFSGGDDLFIIGPWEQVLDFATRLQQDFARYTCQNKSITLSAGVVIQGYSYPVGQAAEEAERAVERSKDGGRDRITVLGHTLTWPEWTDVKRQWEDLRQEETSSAFLYALLEYGQMWHDYRKNGNVLGLRFQPLLAYNLKRNLASRRNPRIIEWAHKLVAWRPHSGDAPDARTLDNLALIGQLLLLWKGGNK